MQSRHGENMRHPAVSEILQKPVFDGAAVARQHRVANGSLFLSHGSEKDVPQTFARCIKQIELFLAAYHDFVARNARHIFRIFQNRRHVKTPYAEESYGFNSHSNETFVPIPISSGNEFT